jgi:hypothetical protein
MLRIDEVLVGGAPRGLGERGVAPVLGSAIFALKRA